MAKKAVPVSASGKIRRPVPKKKATVAALQKEVEALKQDNSTLSTSIAELGARTQTVEAGWNEFMEKWLPKLTERREHQNFAPNEMPRMSRDAEPWSAYDAYSDVRMPSVRNPTKLEIDYFLTRYPNWAELWPGAYPNTPDRMIAEMSDRHVRHSLALLLRAMRRYVGDRILRQYLQQGKR